MDEQLPPDVLHRLVGLYLRGQFAALVDAGRAFPTAPLFDPGHTARHLEAAYLSAHARGRETV